MSSPERFGIGRTWRAAFIDRPNRFLVRCRSRALGTVEAFMPNPGRMWELLLPGVTLYLEHTPAEDRKTSYTAVAVERDGVPVFLHTHVTNRVARWLLEQRRVPGLHGARVIRAEVPVGRSRFDFLLRDRRGDIYLEVKSCTLFGNGVAMFPDAITERGRRHLIELAELARNGARSVVLFVVHTPSAQYFMPDYHTDLAFSRTFLDVRKDVRILPLAVTWRKDLTLGNEQELLNIPWRYIDREAQDRGSYMVVLGFQRDAVIDVGKLGPHCFRRGYYVYVGSAMKGLSARIARHRRLRKKHHWHIDYIRPAASECEILPIRASQRLECDLAAALGRILAPGPRGFGSSDCACEGHLFFSKTHPLRRRDFHEVLERFRMRQPD